MRTIVTKGLPGAVFPEVEYRFRLNERGTPVVLEIPGSWNGPDSCTPHHPEQEAWLNSLSPALYMSWDCQWSFQSAAGVEEFIQLLAPCTLRIEGEAPAPLPQPAPPARQVQKFKPAPPRSPRSDPFAGLETSLGWIETVRSTVLDLPEAEKGDCLVLLDHARRSRGNKPSTAWLVESRNFLKSPGAQQTTDWLCSWFELARDQAHQFLPAEVANLVYGLIWQSGVLPANDRLALALGDLASAYAQKVPGKGPRSVKIVNACLDNLRRIGSPLAVSQLLRLRGQIKLKSIQQKVQSSLYHLATDKGLTKADLEEMSVPDFGFDHAGHLEQPAGDFTAVLLLDPTGHPEVSWRAPSGKSQASVPAAVRQKHAEIVKQVKSLVRQVETTITGQKSRLETCLQRQAVWSFSVWQERYLQNTILSHLASRLIWHFRSPDKSETALWLDGQLVNRYGKSLTWPDAQTEVRLWHPLGFELDVVRGWRERLDHLKIIQPFKQAHREIYMLTDAELNTSSYSNRFAAHIIKQHQFAALCRQRGWQYQVHGGWDSGSTPTLDIPGTGLRAEFFIEPIPDDMSDNHVYLYLTTDQVRFTHLIGLRREPISLSEVPALIFSEVMRDVDLFVGVCSVGADPTWQDGGRGGFGREYWQTYAFGSLSASAESRREIISHLLPKLKIASQCALDDKFLVVRGNIRTYKIHLGSGNILMLPNDQYLCIVSSNRSDDAKVFLPFEGDRTLSLILSKAFLLAADEKIADPTILHQIRSPFGAAG